MTERDWALLVAAIGHVALAALSFSRGGKSPLARPLALLCVDMFGWCFSTLALHVTGDFFWSWLDAAFTALSPPLALHVVVVFVGARRARVRALAAAYVAFGALAAVALAAFVLQVPRDWVESSQWPAIMLIGWAPILVFGLGLLVGHLVTTFDADEKARTRTMLAAFGAGGALATTDLLTAVGASLPRLGALGTLVATSLIAIAVLRLRLFDRDLSVTTAVYVAALAVGAVAAYLVVFFVLGGNAAALVFGTLGVTVVLVSATRELAGAQSENRSRVERLAALGRMSAQMSHDLRNPLAALVGATQVLDGEVPADQQKELLKVVVEQAQRMRAIVEKYERVVRVEPVRSRVQLNDVAERVVAAQRHAAKGVDVKLALAPALPECDADADLFAGALENLVRNAFEAMPHGGSLRVTTRAERNGAGETIVLAVEDTGEGMDARRAERAFDEFFTTKEGGSGLGLAFVRRVAVAHGGGASLASQVGRGTRVELRVPACAG